MTIVCSLTSWYHHLGLISYILQHNLQIKNLVLIKNSFFGKEPLYESEVLDSLATNVFFVKNLEGLSSFLANGLPKDVLLFSSGLYPSRVARLLSKLKITYKVITIEEGIGTYGTFCNKTLAVYREKKALTSNSVVSVFHTLLFCLALLAKKIQFRGVRRDIWLNFDTNLINKNPNVNEGYVKALAYCSDLNPVDAGYTITLNDCLVVSSPFVELGLIDKGEYISILIRLFSDYDRVFIKPHPIEDVSKYESVGFYVLDAVTPVEKIAINIDKKTNVYAFSSTAIYTLSIFLGLNVSRIQTLDLFYQKLGVKQKKIIDDHSNKVDVYDEH